MNPGTALLALIAEADETTLAALAERLRPHMTPEETSNGWLNARQAADYLGMTANALHKHTAARSIPFEQDGRGHKLWFRREDLDRWRRGGGELKSLKS